MITCKYSEDPAIERAYGTNMESRADISLLMAIAQQRDHDAFTELHQRHQKRAFNLSFRILRNRTLAEDAVQEAMLSIWHCAPASLPKGNAEHWIMSIVTNKSIDLGLNQRQRAKREERISVEQNRTEGAVVAEADSELIALLRRHIDQLPDFERTLLACSYGANMPQRDIAKLVNVSQMTVSNRIQDALDRLRKALTNVGVVAVVPLLSAENLFEAITTGTECPPGMTERIMERITDAGSKAVKALARRRPLAAKSSKSVWVATAVAASLAGGMWLAFRSPATAPQMSPATASPKERGRSDEPLYRRWTFEKGMPADIEVRDGEWRWDGKDQMEVASDADLLLPGSMPHKPMMLRITVGNFKKHFEWLGYWSDGDRAGSRRQWPMHLKELDDSEKTITMYLIGHFIFTYLDRDISAVAEYSEVYPARRIAVHLQGMSLKEIELKTLDDREIPATLSDPKTLIAKTGSLAIEERETVFPPRTQLKR